MTSRRYLQPAKWQELVKASHDYLINECKFQPVTLKTSDGLNLAGLLMTRPGARRTVVMCHGYGMTKEYMRPYVDMLIDHNILLFDFRAQGESEGESISIGFHEKKDVLAAIEFLEAHEQLKKLPIFGLGVSMGAASLLAAAQERPDAFKGIVLDSTFSRLFDQICQVFAKRTGLPIMPFMKVTAFLFEYLVNCRIADVMPCQFIEKILCPVLIIHSEHDQVSALASAQELYDHAPHAKELWVVKKSKHGYVCLDYSTEYRQRLGRFVRESCA
jgi:pimeloyl-ACP methyl ester carboxylesterase